MAAVLNGLNGSSTTTDVDEAMAGAEDYLGANGYAAPVKSDRAELNGWASTLADYNEGRIGPGHCDL